MNAAARTAATLDRAPAMRKPAPLSLLCLALSALLLSEPGSAYDYEKGMWVCHDFAEWKRRYEEYKGDPESLYLLANAATAYAKCLIVRGGEGELRGLRVLDETVKYQNYFFAAYRLAYYIRTGGTLEWNTVDPEKIDEAIEAYFKTLQLINNDPFHDIDQVRGFSEEASYQPTFSSYVWIPRLYVHKFAYGLQGSRELSLLASPSSFEAERDLNTYPKYNRYTVDSLEKTVKYADVCLNLAYRDFFYRFDFQAAKRFCRNLKDIAQALLPMEHERLALLADESCGGDLPRCDEYWELEEEMRGIYRMSFHFRNEIYQEYEDKGSLYSFY